MIHQFPRASHEIAAGSALLIDAARCWREAHDDGAHTLPRLSAMLATHEHAMLAPVLDSLCLFYEAALGRPMAVGEALMLSDDEHLLLALLDGSAPRHCLECAEGTASAFDCALCSTRIMLALDLAWPDMPTVQ